MTSHPPTQTSTRELLLLCLGALGVVYGDIGTSPLYAIRECFHGPHALPVTPGNVLGVLSLILWSLVVVISIKYLVLILRADNEGEGGILALMALINPNGRGRIGAWALVILGLFGASLLYGDGVITPAISVLSAVEGLEVATPLLRPYVVPVTLAILTVLFLFQGRGTATIGRAFGPIVLLWLLVLTILGVVSIVQAPDVLAAVNPWHAARFFRANGWHGFMILGIVFLVVTGGEALYADMGHFGRRPIRIAWFSLVLPALLANYFGQGALLLRAPQAAVNPFYHLAPDWALYPVVVLATLATVVASQAVISGTFSLTMQAVHLGYLPRMEVRHTSATEFGQIYVPFVNWALLLSTAGLVVGFGSSSRMASAYGVAITTTMVITTLLAFFAMRDIWRWPLPLASLVTLAFLSVDLGFFGGNIVKVADGGWFPLGVGVALLVVMTTWRRGRQILGDRIVEQSLSFDDLFRDMGKHPPHRTPGAEIHLYSNADGVPPALLRNLRHNRVLHEKVVVVTVLMQHEPYVDMDEGRIETVQLREGFYRVILRYGFMEEPDVPRELGRCKDLPIDLGAPETVYVLGRETLLATDRPGMAIWREKLFAVLSRNAGRATRFYQIPADRVLEIGAQIEL